MEEIKYYTQDDLNKVRADAFAEGFRNAKEYMEKEFKQLEESYSILRKKFDKIELIINADKRSSESLEKSILKNIQKQLNEYDIGS